MYWNFDPFVEMDRIQREMDGLFNRLGVTPTLATTFPTMNIYDNQNEVIVAAELPGVRKEDLNIDLTNSTLTLSGKRERAKLEENAVRLRKERPEGEFSKSFRIPTKVERDKIQASFRDGMLEIHIPKSEEAKPKQIAIEA